jgi:malic enzyme
MEGKVALFKRFADVDGMDLCVTRRTRTSSSTPVRFLGPSFGGINLEDIKAPECFVIEQRLREADGHPRLPRRPARHRHRRRRRPHQRRAPDRAAT